MEDFIDMLNVILMGPDGPPSNIKLSQIVRVKNGEVILANSGILRRHFHNEKRSNLSDIFGENFDLDHLNKELRDPWRVLSISNIRNQTVLKLDHGILMQEFCGKLPKNGMLVSSDKSAKVRIVNADFGTRQLSGQSQLSELRTNQVCQVLKKVYSSTGYQLIECKETIEDLRLHLGGAEQKFLEDCPINFRGSLRVHQVGHVIDPISSKKDFVRTLMEVFENTLETCRCISSERTSDVPPTVLSLSRTACAEIQFQLLSGSIGQPVLVNTDFNHSDACFVLYNYARLNLILETYQDSGNNYPPVPEIVDFTLLDELEEKVIFFDFILQYQIMLKSIVESQDGNIRLHKIVHFLIGLSKIYSRYYNRVRILRDPIGHLLPTIFARIKFLKVIKMIMDHAFSLLNIVPNKKM